MKRQLIMNQMSLYTMYIFLGIHETGTGLGHIGYVGFEWEYSIDLSAFMTTRDDTVIFSKSGEWL